MSVRVGWKNCPEDHRLASQGLQMFLCKTEIDRIIITCTAMYNKTDFTE